jgi:hypothetical protein
MILMSGKLLISSFLSDGIGTMFLTSLLLGGYSRRNTTIELHHTFTSNLALGQQRKYRVTTQKDFTRDDTSI